MHTRRELLSHSARVAAMLLALGLLPLRARAQAGGYDTAAFEAGTLAQAFKALGAATPAPSKDVSVSGPDIAENGAAVPIGAATTLRGVARMLILVEKNPAVLSAMFEITDAVEPDFAIRVKMAQSSNVYAVAMTNDGKVLFAQKEVKVTLGGCAA